MSLCINFEPHSWYKGFAIQKRTLEKDVNANTPINYYLWQAYTDDGNTYRVVKLSALELQGLKHLITEYRSK
jgi:hypothetical protein